MLRWGRSSSAVRHLEQVYCWGGWLYLRRRWGPQARRGDPSRVDVHMQLAQALRWVHSCQLQQRCLRQV